MQVTRTTSEALEQFLIRSQEAVDAGTIRPSTHRERARQLPRLLALQTEAGYCLGDLPYQEVTRRHVVSVLTMFARTPNLPQQGRRLDDGTRAIREGGLPAAATIRNARSYLGAFFRDRDDAYELDRRNPTHGIDLSTISGRRPEREPKFLDLDQVTALIASVPENWRPIVTLLAYTGMRSGEARGLRWRDVDLDARVANVIGQADERGGWAAEVKTRHSQREVGLPRIVVEALREQWKVTGQGEFVFGTKRGLRPDTNSNLRRAIHVGCERAGLPLIGVHALRASFILNADERGMKVVVISQTVGHHSTDFTQRRYMKAKVSLDRKLRELDAAFDGEEES